MYFGFWASSSTSRVPLSLSLAAANRMRSNPLVLDWAVIRGKRKTEMKNDSLYVYVQEQQRRL